MLRKIFTLCFISILALSQVGCFKENTQMEGTFKKNESKENPTNLYLGND
ncbi:hypothetical protein [Clostridium sp. C2-6-12]|nr:hypothetical protein [Clostridium sp. C2-6-12]